MNWEQIDLKWGSGFTWAGAPETGVCQEEGAVRARGLACAHRTVVSGCCVSECKSLQISDMQDSAPLSYLQHLEDSVAIALDGTHSEQGLCCRNFCRLWLADRDFCWLCFPIKRAGSTVCTHFSLCRCVCQVRWCLWKLSEAIRCLTLYVRGNLGRTLTWLPGSLGLYLCSADYEVWGPELCIFVYKVEVTVLYWPIVKPKWDCLDRFWSLGSIITDVRWHCDTV